MLPVVSQAIEEFYVKKNYFLFKELCRKSLDLSEELKKYIKSKDITLEGDGDLLDPEGEWHVYFNSYIKGNFEVSYNTSLRISKLVPVFNVGHYYAVENKGKKTIAPVLDEGGDYPYTKTQQKLHQMIAADLTSKGYTEVHDVDLEETVPNFKLPDGITIFGLNVTVELLLFRDIYNILDDEN